MKNVFSALPVLNRTRTVLLSAGLLAGAAAQAQTQPGVVYALGNVTNGFTFGGITYATGSQTLTAINPTTGTYATGTLATPSIGQPLAFPSGTSGQTVVGLDFRPSTGDLYALGFNAQLAAPANNAQLYTVNISTGALTAVGGPIRLEISDNNRSNTRGVIPNIGFDFNPRVDRIRVVAPNGADYRLNPNTGAVAATDGTLFYNGSATVPYVGTVAYTNSRLGLTGTTLYDIDVTANAAVLSTQAPPNNGQLNRVNPVTFFLPNATAGNMGPYPIASPTVGLGLDIYGSTTAYLIEARLSDNSQTTVTPATRYTSNFYTFDLTSGQATLVANIIGQVTLFYSDIAAPISTPKTWTGQVSTNWGADGNWFPMGVPTATDDVVIPGNGTFVTAASVAVTQQPIVSDLEQAASVNLTNGALLTTANGGTLNISGNFVNNDGAVAGSGTGTVALVGSATQDIGGNALSAFQNLSVGAANATTSGAAAVARALTLTGAGNLAIGAGQAFTLRSVAGGTAFVDNRGSGVVTGAATVQRYIDASGNTGSSGYRQYSSPITSATVSSLTTTGQGGSFVAQVNPAYNTQDPNTLTLANYPNVFSYDETKIPGSPAVTFSNFDKGYQSPQALSDPLIVGRSYTVQIGNNEKVQFTGQLNNGNITIGGLTRTGNTDGSGWALVGNPYPSPLDWGTVTNAQLTNVNAAVYVFQSTEAYKGRYTSFTNGIGAGTGLIASSQGFFVRASSSGGAIALTNANRGTSATTSFQRTAAETRPLLRLSLGLGSSPATIATAQDETFVYFEQGATAAFDGRFDAYKLANPNGYYLGTAATVAPADQPANLSIDGRAPLAATSPAEVVSVRLSAPAGTYSLTATSLLNFATAGTQVYLRDALLGTLTNLATTPSYSFSLAANAASTDRFSLVFGSATALATAPSAALAQTLATLYPNPATGADNVTLAITGLPQDVRQVEATLVNTLGQVVRRTLLAAAQGNAHTNLPTTNLAGGVYLLRLSAQDAQGQVVGSLPAQRLSLR